MLSGFYTAASGMLMNQRRLNTIANNMANMNTPGYQARKLVGTDFETELLRQQGNRKTQIGTGAPIAVVAEEAIDFTQGNYNPTNRPYDLAINGAGFFTVQGEDGERLTRNGNFDRDAEGYLVLNGVGRVLGTNGAIRVDSAFFSVGPAGGVYGADGALIDQLRIVEPDDYGNLVPGENAAYTMNGGQTTRVFPEIQQGILEESNVSLNAETTAAMAAQRAFQTCGKALSIVDQMNQKTASEIGKI